MKTSLMKFNSTFLKLAHSLGEINTHRKMIWEYFEFKELAILKVLLRLKFQCLNYLSFKRYQMKTSLMKFNSTFLVLVYSKGQINTIQKMIWEYYEFEELAI